MLQIHEEKSKFTSKTSYEKYKHKNIGTSRKSIHRDTFLYKNIVYKNIEAQIC